MTAYNVNKYQLIKPTPMDTDPSEYGPILRYIRSGIHCDTLPHGAEVWEINGQNVCITTGLSDDAGKEDIRQLVFFPQGILTSSWVTVNGSRIF